MQSAEMWGEGVTKRWGAEVEDWCRFDFVLGLTQHMLPAVCNMGAVLSPLSNIRSIGKVPTLYNRNRQVVGIPDWTGYIATSADIDRWSREKDYALSVQTREIRALDIDVENPALAAEILSFLRAHFGARMPPRRWRATSAKCLLAFRLPGEMPKRILRVDGGIIEFLANGQQFIAFGTHVSGARYQWDWNGHTNFPLVTHEEFEVLWASLTEKFSISSVVQLHSVSRNRADTPALDIADPLLDTLPVIAWGREGQAFIECPFKHLHTMDSGITETTYFPAGTRGYEQGHFRCLHAHCEDKSDADFLDALGLRFNMFEVIPEEKERKVFNIKPKGGDLPRVVAEAEEALLYAEVPYFQRGAALVRPLVDAAEAAHGRKTRTVRLYDIDAYYLAHELCKVANWFRFNATQKKWIKINAPMVVAMTLLANCGHWRFPKVVGIITTPTLRPDGSLLSRAGYDEQTGLLLVSPPPMPEMKEYPAQEDALAALNLLKDLLMEFPFVGQVDRSVALSALITPVVRGAFQVAPMHIIRAPVAGSGKSFLVDIASTIASGLPCPAIAAGRTEEETEKRLGAVLMSGQPLISIDNVNGALGGDFLCQLVERPVVDVRVLGKSEKVQIESRSTVFANGNNLYLTGDMVRRAVLCMLDAKSERPELRRFQDNPVRKVLAERGKYIAAVLTIVRAYIAAGRPGRATSLASFEAWSDTVRSALMWLGEADPVTSMETARKEDPQMQNMINIFNSMQACIGLDTPKSACEILKLAQLGTGLTDEKMGAKYETFSEELLIAAGSTNGRVTAKSLGRWMSRHKGRIGDGLRLEGKIDKHNHTALWWVSEESLI